MAHPLTIPTIMALTLTGSGLGLYLGKSAIGEIDPVHYSGPASGSSFYSDLVPNGPERDGQPALRDAVLSTGLGGGCVGCRTYPEEYVPVRDPAMDSYTVVYPDYGPVAAAEVIDDVEREIDEMMRRAHREAIERYAHFPITVEDEDPVRISYGSAAPGPAVLSDNGCAAGNTCAGAPTPGI